MGLLLNSLVKNILIAAVKFYKIFLSQHTKTYCIYNESCSSFALKILEDKSNSITNSFFMIRNRLKSCTINTIVKSDYNEIIITNGIGNIIDINILSQKARMEIDEILSSNSDNNH